jgi:hypothetical protein
MFRLTGCQKTIGKAAGGLAARAAALAAAAALVQPRLAAACTACFGAADSPMVHGQNRAILALLAVVGVIQVGVVRVVWGFHQRAKRLPPPPTAEPARHLRLIHGGKH